MSADDGLPRIAFATAAEWEEWLDANHDSDGVWVEIAKKGTGIESVRYPEVLESALCFGWIDGRREALDERYFLQRYTPRRSRSKWSMINRENAERLIREGRMRPAGLAEVERAKADGRWDAAYEGQRRSVVPDDLQRELDARPRAKATFDALNSQNRYRPGRLEFRQPLRRSARASEAGPAAAKTAAAGAHAGALQRLELLQRAAGALRHAGQGVVRELGRHAGLHAAALLEVAQQRPAACQQDPALGDVRG